MNFKSLISEDNENVSIGRVILWILLIACLLFWYFKPKELPDTLYYIFIYVLAYNFGKKLIAPFTKILDSKSPKELIKDLVTES